MVLSKVFIKEELKLDFSEIEKREFGFVYSGAFRRKLHFKNKEMLVYFIDMIRPLDSFVSNARYEDPKNMNGFIGCDFFIDIDGEIGKTDSLFYDVQLCLQAMVEDFGFKNIVVNKSGAKGYHIIVSDDSVQDLKPGERDEMIQYVQERYKVTSIDVPCSCDIHRVRRIEGTVNSKSGVICKRLKTIIDGKDTKEEITNENS